ncbi:hypothetical protein ACWZHB_02765 [Nocardia sp. FBN12]|uniref:helix-turn-helix domain-containing protein n=1 Tax=Nocardia sp. FBN12 TaxID=3419766 RepID=UPI003D000012
MAGREWWDTDHYQWAIRHSPGRAVAALRDAAKVSQHQLAARMSRAQSWIAKGENGDSGAFFDIRKLIAVTDTLGVPPAALFPLLLNLSTHNEATSGKRSEGHVSGGESVDRRDFGKLAVFGVAASIMSVPVSGAVVGIDGVAFFRNAVDALNTADQQHGSGHVGDSAIAQYRSARALLDNGSFTNSTGLQLARVTGELAECAGWLAYDNGDHEFARRCYTEALTLAAESGDDTLMIRVLQSMTRQSCHLGRAQEAVRFSGRAADLTRRAESPRLHALVAARVAISHAAAQDAHGFDRAIGQAWREVDHGLDNSDDVWLQFVTVSEVRAHEAKGRRYLGHHASAADLYRAIADGSDSSPRDRVTYRACLAASLAGLGDRSAALEEGLTTVDVLEQQVQSRRIVREMQPLRALCDIAKDDASIEFRERYDTLIAS